MNVTHIFAAGSGFRILDTTERSQSGLLTLEPGESSSEKPSVHKDSDQTLVLLAGELKAEIGDEKAVLEDGDAVLVPAKTPHRFINTGKSRATTFSVYARPAFPPNQQSD
ncbi:MAG: cupin domain-containing protein [Verrucomicrobiota bacterium]|jgi:mannose-6-phosphate isomerase-like protein (cupin superfamily)|nr:cupin domain-containing protein [Chthoniobacterales bacterium]MDQ3545040.1 cupin domain-containing protein [Verrucomicrobiota bacterium]